MLGGIVARKIYKVEDRIPVKIDDIKIIIAPLTYEVKCEIQAELVTGSPLAIVKAAKMAIQHGVKGIEGVEHSDGSEYQLDFEANALTEDCVSDLLNIDQDNKISFVCTKLLEGIPSEFVDPQTGEKIKGIKIERPSVPRKKK